jgi:predicted transcriptional regulator of viral defense system
MGALDQLIDDRLSQGLATFSRQEAEAALQLKSATLTAALTRLSKRKRIVSPYRGFFLILRPENRNTGAPDPELWIDPLMRFLNLDYRVSLLRAASVYGASHQAAMVFQVVVPRQLRSIEIGRQRVEFIYQAPSSFTQVNRPESLINIKTMAGFARCAGVELTLLDCIRYYHRAGGLQHVMDISLFTLAQANPAKLAYLAENYESSCVRRLGYIAEYLGFKKHAKALEPFSRQAKTAALLDPGIKPISQALDEPMTKNERWKLIINTKLEIDI